MTRQWARKRKSIDDYLVGDSDVCLPVDGKGREITDPKKIGNPSKLPKEYIFVSVILLLYILELTILLLMSVSLQGTCQFGCSRRIRLPGM